MTRKTAIVICPGRGTYNKPELGYLARHHAEKSDLMEAFDVFRAEAGQETLTGLDSAGRFSGAKHTRGDNASALIYAAGVMDFKSISQDIEIVGITGNSLGWYTSTSMAGAVDDLVGMRIVNTMGILMQDRMIGGQLIYPFSDENWQAIPDAEALLFDLAAEINARKNHLLSLSIHLGGMLVLAGNESGLKAFEKIVPPLEGRYPMRLPNHAGFHTALQAPVAAAGRARLPENLMGVASLPLIDGRGQVWWPGCYDAGDLWRYTLDTQVVEPYNFTRAVQSAARSFAPDMFIIAGPGTTLGGAVAQSLIGIGWQGMRSKQDFMARQKNDPLVISMGREDQRELATG